MTDQSEREKFISEYSKHVNRPQTCIRSELADDKSVVSISWHMWQARAAMDQPAAAGAGGEAEIERLRNGAPPPEEAAAMLQHLIDNTLVLTPEDAASIGRATAGREEPKP